MVMNPGDLSSFGALLKVFRKRRNLTQQQFAIAIGVHRNAIGRWEQGEVLPAHKGTVLELARHLYLDDQETRQLLEASLTGLSTHWLVPFPRNPLFTGREEMLSMLHTRLGSEQAVTQTQTCALHGLGGVGKTQIALEYAYRHALEYRAVFWMGAETSEHILSGFLDIAEVLQLSERHDQFQRHVVMAVQRWLNAHSQWLLIWDNLEDLALLDRFLPSTRSGAILVTTRCSALGARIRGIDVLPMEQGEGKLFLLRRAKVLEPEATQERTQVLVRNRPGEDTAAERLVEVMDGLPLALDQAGAYIEETKCTLGDYLQHYEQQHARFLDRRGTPSGDHPQSVAATFRLLWQRLQQEQPEAADLLCLCTFLHAEAIPEELFPAGASSHPERRLDSAQFDLAIAVLRSFSLVQRQPETRQLSLHRLVQVVLQEEMNEQQRVGFQRRVVHLLNAAFPEITSRMGSETWGQCERLLPHILTCAATIPEHPQDRDLAELFLKAGYYLYERFQDNQAELLHQRALRLLEQLLGSEHPQVAESLCKLAFLHRAQGKYEQAEPLFWQALRLFEQALGPEHLQVADPLTGLAILCKAQGKYEQAEPLYQRALQIREQALGPEHPDVAPPLNNLALLYCDMGKYEQAEQLGRRALHLFEQALGPHDPNLAFLLDTVATICRVQGKDEQAESLYQRALRLFETLGPEDLRVAIPLEGLALLRSGRGKYGEAEALYQRALRIRERHLGQQHPDIAKILAEMARMYKKWGKDEQAEAMEHRVSPIFEQQRGQAHAETTQVGKDDHRVLDQRRKAALISNREHPTLVMSVPVRGTTEQVAYTRTVRMREVTFICTVCGQTVTQWHYPSGRIKYCSEECRAIRAAQQQEGRVARQREKRRAEREAQLRTPPQNAL